METVYIRRKIMSVFVIWVTAVGIVLSGFILAAYMDHAKDMDGYAIEQIVVIEEENKHEGGN